MNEISAGRIKKGAIRYASEQMNSIEKGPRNGIREIASIERKINEAFLAYEKEKENSNRENENIIVTAEEIREAMAAQYREQIEEVER